MVLLGGALWRHRSMELAEEARKQAVIAARTAEANAESPKQRRRAGRSQGEGRRRRRPRLQRRTPRRTRPRPSRRPTKAAPAPASGTRRRATARQEQFSKPTVAATTAAKPARQEGRGGVGKKKGDDVIDKLLASYK